MSLPLAKACDAADWFDPALLRIVRDELREPPRFHRKQWEFAVVFRALAELGLLGPEREGVALGGGRERLLYALAPRLRRLTVTDLYGPDTPWDEARTDDPLRFVREGAPFPADLSRLEVLRMDMRELALPDEAFDFAYSCCAIEHIGQEADFLRHLCEVHRVLKPGGAYVFTTELHYGRETIEDPGNFVFGTEALASLLESGPLRPQGDCWCGLAPHQANAPLPEDVASLFDAGALGGLLRDLPHVQLLRGGWPHSSAVLVLRKSSGQGRAGPLAFPGLEDARDFLAPQVEGYRRWLEGSTLALAPSSFLPGGPSRFLGGDGRGGDDALARMVFHTRYAWLGGGRRRFSARLRPGEGRGRLELRVHRQPTFGRGSVEAVVFAALDVSGLDVEVGLGVDVDADSSYAFLGEFVDGGCPLLELAATVGPASAP